MGRTQSDTDTVESDRELYNVVEDGFDIQIVERLYVCSLCDFSATGPLNIVEHIQSHSRESPWDCWRCAHLLLGENVGDDEPHNPSCPDYLEGTRDGAPESLEVIESTRPEEEHKCTLCPYKSKFLSKVVDHIGQHLRKKRDASDPSETVEESTKNWDNAYTCTECEFSCINPEKLGKHMETHAPDAKFVCHECGCEAVSRLELLRHKRRVHGFVRPYECTLCPAKFTRLDNLKSHIKIHTGERQLTCKKCSFTSPSRARLIAHYNSHKDGHPLRSMGICPVCRRSFSSYPLLENHRKTHVLSPPYVCRTCDEDLGSVEDLYNHQTAHIDSATTSCPFCGFKCFDVSRMHHHLGLAHGSEKPFQCEACSYRFSSLVHWKRHQLVHTGVKPYQCELCLARFSQAGNRKSHMIKIHNLFIPLVKGRNRSNIELREEIIVVHEQ